MKADPMTGESLPVNQKSRTKLTPKMLDTLATFAIEPELRKHALGRQAIGLHFADGTRATRSAKSTLWALVERGYLENCVAGNTSAVRLTQKGKDFLND